MPLQRRPRADVVDHAEQGVDVQRAVFFVVDFGRRLQDRRRVRYVQAKLNEHVEEHLCVAAAAVLCGAGVQKLLARRRRQLSRALILTSLH